MWKKNLNGSVGKTQHAANNKRWRQKRPITEQQKHVRTFSAATPPQLNCTLLLNFPCEISTPKCHHTLRVLLFAVLLVFAWSFFVGCCCCCCIFLFLFMFCCCCFYAVVFSIHIASSKPDSSIYSTLTILDLWFLAELDGCVFLRFLAIYLTIFLFLFSA